LCAELRNRSWRYRCLAAVFVTAASLGAMSPAPARGSGDAVVGFVTDDAGSPQRGTPVTVYGDDRTLLVEGRANDAGGFCLASDALSEGPKYTICVPVTAGKAACADGRANTVAGAMLGRDASPLSGRAVTVYANDWTVVATGTTDGDGIYCVTNDQLLSGQAYRVCVSGVSAAWVFGGVSGWMFGAQDQPLANAAITVKDVQGQRAMTGQTGDDGHYLVAANDLVAGSTYRVCVEAPALRGACPPATAPAMAGSLFDAAAQPIGAADVAVEDATGRVLVEGKTDKDGFYCLADSQLTDGEIYFVCVDRTAMCSGCRVGGCCQQAWTEETTAIPVWLAGVPPAIIVPILESGGGPPGRIISPSQ
jgi:hypothetical protein